MNELVDMFVEKDRIRETKDASDFGWKKKGSEDYDMIATEKKIIDIIPKITDFLDDPKEGIEILKKMVTKNHDRFSVAFAGSSPEGLIEDFINIFLFEIKRLKLADKEKLEKWKKNFEENGIVIHF